MDPEKPGYTTTEFWVTLGGVILSFVTALMALIHPGFEVSGGVQGLITATAPLAALIGTSVYTLGRSKVKAEAVTGRQQLANFKADLALLAVDTRPSTATAKTAKK